MNFMLNDRLNDFEYFCQALIHHICHLPHPIHGFWKIHGFSCFFLPGMGVGPLFGWSAYGKARAASTYCGFDFKQRGWGTIFYFVTVMLCAFVVPILITGMCFAAILWELHKKREHNRLVGFQPHLAQCYSRRKALMLNSVHESKIYFTVQLGVNKLVFGG